MKFLLLFSLIVITSPVQARDLGFRYKDGSCLNGAGQKGLNPSYIGQCGDLRHVVLSRFSLDEMDLSGTTFEEADLQDSSMRAATLLDVNFKKANLSGVVLEEAILKRNDFSGAILLNAHFAGAQIEDALFAAANMTGVVLNFSKMAHSSFLGATLTNAEFDSSDLRDSDFTNATAGGAIFKNATLNNSIVAGANFSGANFSRANLIHISGALTNFSNAILRHADLTSALLPDVLLNSAQMDNANLTDAQLLRANMRSTALLNSTVTGTNFTGALFNRQTALPFSLDEAKSLGMIFAPMALFVLWDEDNTDLAALIVYLENNGIEVKKSTKRPREFDAAELTQDYTAVLHLAGSSNAYSNDLPTEGQQKLVNFVNNGGTYIATQWTGYMSRNGLLMSMKDLILLTYESGDFASRSYTPVQNKLAHPVLTGIEGPFTLDSGFANSKLVPFETNPSESLMKIGDFEGVAIRSLGIGKVVNFSFAASYASDGKDPHVLLQRPVQQLIQNSIQW